MRKRKPSKSPEFLARLAAEKQEIKRKNREKLDDSHISYAQPIALNEPEKEELLTRKVKSKRGGSQTRSKPTHYTKLTKTESRGKEQSKKAIVLPTMRHKHRKPFARFITVNRRINHNVGIRTEQGVIRPPANPITPRNIYTFVTRRPDPHTVFERRYVDYQFIRGEKTYQVNPPSGRIPQAVIYPHDGMARVKVSDGRSITISDNKLRERK